jgi:hypothetical protein
MAIILAKIQKHFNCKTKTNLLGYMWDIKSSKPAYLWRHSNEVKKIGN